MSYERLRPAFTFDAERLEQLKTIAPEAFADGAINWEALRTALGDHVEDEGADAEHFGLFWPGKRAARRRASEPSRGTLIPVAGEGVNEETTRNVFIEADNLDALKLLQKAYAGRVKMMFIDPPYNTGSDLIYRDDFRDQEVEYLQKTGQISELGQLLTTNSKADGRFHTNWLNMIYPRLRLARSLLRDDGAIFVSIDDNEVNHLRLVLDEVFGAENFVGIFIWQKMDSPSRNDAARIASVYHDYILVYAKNKESAALFQMSKPGIRGAYPLRLQDGRLARRRQLRKNGKGARREDRKTMYYPLEAPDGSIVYPIAPEGWDGRWVLSEETWQERSDQGLTEWIKRDYGWVPYYIEIAPDEPTIPWPTLWTDVDQNRQAKAKFTEIMGATDFDNPKPVNLLTRMLQMSSTEEDICLDFFAGSGSTAHAVLEQNRADGSSRRFILIQIAAPSKDTNFTTIDAIAKERIRRVIEQMNANQEAEVQLELDDTNLRDLPEDLGFKVYKFHTSSYRHWFDFEGDDVGQLELRFNEHITPLIEGWRPEVLLIEVMLQLGFPLDSRIETLTAFTANTVQRVSSDFHAHSLYACFDATIADETVAALSLKDEDIFVCLDSALTDQTKARLADVCNLRTI